MQGTPCGRLLAASLPDLVPQLRRFKELQIDDDTAALLLKIAPATIDRRLRAVRSQLEPRGRSPTKPGSLLKDSIPMRTWAQWDEAVPKQISARLRVDFLYDASMRVRHERFCRSICVD